jgi:formylglycine-generating enzyme required for sulfatase activity
MARVLGRFCIDRYEASADEVSPAGHTLRHHSPYHPATPGALLRARSRKGVVPQAHFSQTEALAACTVADKRLCSDQEWLTACRGSQRWRYPYGSERRAGYCNDHGVSPLRLLHGADDSLETFGWAAMNDPRLNQVPGSIARTGEFTRCRNSSGIFDLVGNLHEWTANVHGTFRGGYYLDTALNGEGCDYVTKAHSVDYHDYSIGFRCCRDLPRSGGDE